MSVDEWSRHQLYLKLEEVLGPDEATILMEHLPPTGWADVATKRDLDHLRADIEQLELRLVAQFRAELHAELNKQTRTFTRSLLLANTASVVTVAGLAFAAARLV